jgi:hypothetical protein
MEKEEQYPGNSAVKLATWEMSPSGFEGADQTRL